MVYNNWDIHNVTKEELPKHVQDGFDRIFKDQPLNIEPIKYLGNTLTEDVCNHAILAIISQETEGKIVTKYVIVIIGQKGVFKSSQFLLVQVLNVELPNLNSEELKYNVKEAEEDIMQKEINVKE